MKLIKIARYGQLLVLGSALLITGCASEPVKTELAIHHPANARAPETPFIRPPTPFKTEGSMAGLETEDNVHMHHESPEDPHRQSENHQMDQMKKSESTHGSETEKAAPAHKEHHQ